MTSEVQAGLKKLIKAGKFDLAKGIPYDRVCVRRIDVDTFVFQLKLGEDVMVESGPMPCEIGQVIEAMKMQEQFVQINLTGSN